MNESEINKVYKKRVKSLQKRVEIEHQVNIRLVNLLKHCETVLQDGLLKDSVKHELNMLKYKYYSR